VLGEVGARNFRATVEYDGTEYGGFQIQVSRATIQGELERALQRLTQTDVRVHGAGRTDAGVHARGQVISFHAAWRHETAALQRAMNAVLPRDVAVRELAEAEQTFHARYSATRRQYVYQVYRSETRSPLSDRFAHHVARPLNVAAMNEAAGCLCGVHDFTAFGQPPAGEVTLRRVYRAEWATRAEWGRAESTAPGDLAPGPERCWFEIEANAFLRGMVRRIVGTLLPVGLGLFAPRDVEAVLASRDISQASPPAPACGLCLWRVWYE
jgi:tRNA pseudouridine38-40 synthase